jgi:single-stranded-DNA-specific exonuclease
MFFKSGHVKLSNFKQEELWLFGKRDEIKKHPVLSILPLKSDNMQKLQETMNKQEAEKNKWERYSQYKKYYNFIIEAEIDYSYFNNQLGTQISVKKFK